VARDAAPVEAALAAAAAAGPAFISLTPQRARAEAAAGGTIPIAWKDLFDVAGSVTTAGSPTRRDLPPATQDAPVVAALARAGYVCVGKTNLSEFAFSGLGLNPGFGTPAHPLDPTRVPGGSSSGSAAAVAAGVVPVAMGTDTSGSIRIPAAFCGIVGFKPTADRYDRTGVVALAPSLDSVGPLTTTVIDAIKVDGALRGRRGFEADVVLRFVVPEGELVEEADPLVCECFEAALTRLRERGATIERRPLTALDHVLAGLHRGESIVAAEAYREHAALLERPETKLMDQRVFRRLQTGRPMLEDGTYDRLVRERPELQRRNAAELVGAFALWPTVRHVAPRLAPLEADADAFVRTNLRTLLNTMPASQLDMPGVSIPMGTAEDGLPCGLLVSGPTGSDEHVLAAALAVEDALA
jgi:aspartyl-tRNA(Asn)/glutamyl-tRNA(Gln) amidotransferase subunit A